MELTLSSCYSLVPSKVKNIHISHDGQSSSLRVNWTPGQGDVDRYSVSLSHMAGQAEERSVPKHENEMSFNSLLPGQQYMITVTSVSGSLINNSTAAGRTGMHITAIKTTFGLTIFLSKKEHEKAMQNTVFLKSSQIY